MSPDAVSTSALPIISVSHSFAVDANRLNATSAKGCSRKDLFRRGVPLMKG